MSTVYTVQSFTRGRKGALIADAPLSVGDDRHALRVANRYSESRDGVIAFAQRGDPATGEVIATTVLVQHGSVPIMDFEVPY